MQYRAQRSPLQLLPLRRGRLRYMMCCLVLLLPSMVAAQIAVVSERLAHEPLDRQRLGEILLGRVTTWSDGKPIVIVLSRAEADADAIRILSGRDLGQLLRGWKRLVFSGRGAMPLVVEDTAQSLAVVRRRPGAIALVGKIPSDEKLHILYEPESDE